MPSVHSARRRNAIPFGVEDRNVRSAVVLLLKTFDGLLIPFAFDLSSPPPSVHLCHKWLFGIIRGKHRFWWHALQNLAMEARAGHISVHKWALFSKGSPFWPNAAFSVYLANSIASGTKSTSPSFVRWAYANFCASISQW